MKKHLSKIIFFLFSLLFGSILHAQNKVHITGIVRDEKDVPLAGVSIIVKGNTTGVTTDDQGAFAIDAPSKKSILVITYIGFQTQELAVGSKSNFIVKLLAGSVKLDEVVVVGYGTQKRTSVTAAVSMIMGEDIAAQPVADISNSLGGRAAGIIFTQGSGEPGYDGSNILIRGISTTGNTQPLVIVDGIPRNFTQLD